MKKDLKLAIVLAIVAFVMLSIPPLLVAYWTWLDKILGIHH